MRFRHPVLLLSGLVLLALTALLWRSFSPRVPSVTDSIAAAAQSTNRRTSGAQNPSAPAVNEDRTNPPSEGNNMPGAILPGLGAGLAGEFQTERRRPGERPSVQGVKVAAWVQLGDGKVQELRPNQIGVFPRQLVQARQVIPVTLSYPTSQAGEKVVLTVRHGGDLDGGQGVVVTPIADDGTVQFNFTSGKDDGVYHVEARRSTDVKIVDFWVGELPRLAGE